MTMILIVTAAAKTAALLTLRRLSILTLLFPFPYFLLVMIAALDALGSPIGFLETCPPPAFLWLWTCLHFGDCFCSGVFEPIQSGIVDKQMTVNDDYEFDICLQKKVGHWGRVKVSPFILSIDIVINININKLIGLDIVDLSTSADILGTTP